MKRRVRRLEVTTFPFLAVLLCTMGSLILLLFVFDRRAKVAALQKASEVSAQRMAQLDDASKETEQRKAEWERRRQELHATMTRQQDELEIKVQQARKRTEEAESKFKLEKGRAVQQQVELNAGEQKLATIEQALSLRMESTAKEQAKTEAARRELEFQASELLKLEQALADLKALRKRQENTYSVVPYLGSRGDNRKPIYLECSGEGLTFHPDRVALTGLRLSATNLRQEVEKRTAEFAGLKPAKSGDSTLRPYLLMLVRPNGIDNYYKAQEALAELKLDFGYEFIDQDWALDLSGSSTGATTPADVLPFKDPPPPNLTRPPTFGAGGSIVAPPPGAKSATGPQPISSPHGGGFAPSLGSLGPKGQPPGTIGSAPSVFGPTDKASGQGGKAGVGAAAQPAPAPPPGDSTGQQGGSSGGAALKGPQPPPAPSLGRILGNRDLIIVIECRVDGVTMKSGNQKFPLAVLSAPTKGQHSLVNCVRDFIARRQATLGPGEPPFRPMLRFQVHPDGLTAYYLAYPLLEVLQVPMQRGNASNDR